MVFRCEPITAAEMYFTGKLNGEDFCVSVPNEDYWQVNGIATTSSTSTANPTFSSDSPIISTFYEIGIYPPIFDNYYGLTEDFHPRVIINTPEIKEDTIYNGTLRFKQLFCQSY